jgi:hypothetical protein
MVIRVVLVHSHQGSSVIVENGLKNISVTYSKDGLLSDLGV